MNLTASTKDASKLLSVERAEDVLGEVLEIIGRISPDFDTAPLRNAFDAAARLYSGDFPGYRACNTGYHDFAHAVATFLAMSRLIHGAVLEGQKFSDRHIIVALIAAILHDAGYIQQNFDTRGTGARYKEIHERRSIEFLNRHGFEFGLSEAETAAGRCIILCTDMGADIGSISFPSPRIELLGKLLGAADLMAQLSERHYLEKLLYLYYECREAGMDEYESELDILQKAAHFYDRVEARFKTALDGVDRFMQPHFAARWHIHADPYRQTMRRQRDYLAKILRIPDADPRDYLKRGGIVKKIRRTYPQNKPNHP